MNTNITKNTNNIDVAISFDCTGSMYACLGEVRYNIQRLVSDMFKLVSGLRVAIIAHGDYCDAGKTYVTKILDFTNDVSKICNFVQNVERTDGGDAPECYELVLNKARQLSWQSGKAKAFVLIGDDVPHGPTYPGNTQHIDWRNELGLLLEANINVYGVHALSGCRRHSKQFYEEIAAKTGGFYLTLDQFSQVNDLLLAIAAKQEGDETLEKFADNVQASGRMTPNLGRTVGTLLKKTTKYSKSSTIARNDNLIPVSAGRFQTMYVDNDDVIMDFVVSRGATFTKGRGFYELTKSEKVQGNKEIVLFDKNTGEIFNGPQVRKILGLSEGIDGRLSSKDLLDKYKIFVQSNSYNRKLVKNTMFLYEVDDWSI